MKFFIEAWNRLGMPNSPFYKVIQAISVVTAFIATVPSLIVKFQADLHITEIPTWILNSSTKAVFISSIVAWFISQLSVNPPIVTSDPAPLLPYTLKENAE